MNNKSKKSVIMTITVLGSVIFTAAVLNDLAKAYSYFSQWLPQNESMFGTVFESAVQLLGAAFIVLGQTVLPHWKDVQFSDEGVLVDGNFVPFVLVKLQRSRLEMIGIKKLSIAGMKVYTGKPSSNTVLAKFAMGARA